MNRSRVLLAVAAAALLLTTGAGHPPVDGAAGAGDPYYPTDGNGGIDVLDYDLGLTYAPDTRLLTGEAVVTARATRALRRFNLDLNGLTVTAVTVDGRPARFTREAEHELVITPDDALRRGAGFRAVVRYEGRPAPLPHRLLGLSGWQDTSTGGVFAAGAPHTATTWFPANDVPTDKATFRLTATVPTGWTVVSNGREAGSTTGPGWTTYRWAQTRPMATYLSLLAIDRFTVERTRLGDGTPVVHAYAPGVGDDKRSLAARLPEIIGFMASRFGPYPQDAAGGVFLADPVPFSMETQGRPVYAAYADLATVVHETAHQWFGDSATVRQWKDVCVSECFASYAPWLWDEAKDGADLDARYRDLIAQAEEWIPDFWTRPLYDMGPNEEFNYPVYLRGPLALHALRHRIGERAFASVLRSWPTLHAHSNATWPEFEAFAARVSGQDLTAFFDAWARGTTRPAPEHLWPGTLGP
ncbi:M1 family metallopeptidase [Virgisporangium ochraceum]|uniref:Aminopeptidase N n=1 Tax=Virgisporangium ochraceum TaxID=65505 RepID=A0A8J4A2X7_9ACTN|nr:M1 family metallopeptidase [Virgisporangium ochraceum]GIJ73833.1 peptidase [Virgisporangium ochraceum]